MGHPQRPGRDQHRARRRHRLQRLRHPLQRHLRRHGVRTAAEHPLRALPRHLDAQPSRKARRPDGRRAERQPAGVRARGAPGQRRPERDADQQGPGQLADRRAALRRLHRRRLHGDRGHLPRPGLVHRQHDSGRHRQLDRTAVLDHHGHRAPQVRYLLGAQRPRRPEGHRGRCHQRHRELVAVHRRQGRPLRGLPADRRPQRAAGHQHRHLGYRAQPDPGQHLHLERARQGLPRPALPALRPGHGTHRDPAGRALQGLLRPDGRLGQRLQRQRDSHQHQPQPDHRLDPGLLLPQQRRVGQRLLERQPQHPGHPRGGDPGGLERQPGRERWQLGDLRLHRRQQRRLHAADGLHPQRGGLHDPVSCGCAPVATGP
ncbi:hypothetical protein SBRY_40533 [Actinacidiphila bryophytorum]|uniref:Uncharacterized protein n=1 Tax=Actinacidiphila bryophytorum TaxID=1436133 RepID=A0A9W4MD81_9ACTN|nr:hypothetical protein SBRY_40533 [Actinacidiphila bryophytorum]